MVLGGGDPSRSGGGGWQNTDRVQCTKTSEKTSVSVLDIDVGEGKKKTLCLSSVHTTILNFQLHPPYTADVAERSNVDGTLEPVVEKDEQRPWCSFLFKFVPTTPTFFSRKNG